MYKVHFMSLLSLSEAHQSNPISLTSPNLHPCDYRSKAHFIVLGGTMLSPTHKIT